MRKSAIQKTVLVAIHVIGWGFVFLLPLFIVRNASRPITWTWYSGFCALPLACVLLFYTNTFLIIERTLFRKRIIRFVLVNLIYIVSLGLLLHAWQEFHRDHFYPPQTEQNERRPSKKNTPTHPLSSSSGATCSSWDSRWPSAWPSKSPATGTK